MVARTRKLTSLVTALIVLIMLFGLVALLAQPASADPGPQIDQGSGWWTDAFSDETGINSSASTNITVSATDVVLGEGTGNVTVFNDGFERSGSTPYYHLDWLRLQTDWDEGTGHVGTYSAHADYSGSSEHERYGTEFDEGICGEYIDFIATKSGLIDLSGAPTAYVDFWVLGDADFDSGEMFRVRAYDGSSWVIIYEEAGNSNSSWHHVEEVEVPASCLISDARFMITIISDNTNEDVYVDEFRIRRANCTTSGTVRSTAITPSILINWDSFGWDDDEPGGTDIKYYVEYNNSGTWEPIPDVNLSGNEAGFDTSPVDLSGLDVDTYTQIRLKADLSTSDTSVSPTLHQWYVTWNYWSDGAVLWDKIASSTNVTSGGDATLEDQGQQQTAFNDSFEGTLSKWEVNYRAEDASDFTQWATTTVQKYDGTHSVRTDPGGGTYSMAAYMMSNDIDLSDATAANLDFWFRHEEINDMDFGFLLYNGITWVGGADLNSYNSTDNEWCHYNESIDLSIYGVSNFRVRFDAGDVLSGRWVYVDALYVNKTVPSYETPGNLTSTPVAPQSPINWDVLGWRDTEPAGTDIKYQIEYNNSGTWELIPDVNLSGNSAGFDDSPVDLSGLDVDTYSQIRLTADLSTTNTSLTPTLHQWYVTWDYWTDGPVPWDKIESSTNVTSDGAVELELGASSSTYDFSSGAGSNKWAWDIDMDSYIEVEDRTPGYISSTGTEASGTEYGYIDSSDANRWATSLATGTDWKDEGRYNVQMYNISISETLSAIEGINVSWYGYGEDDDDAQPSESRPGEWDGPFPGYDTTLRIWDYENGRWVVLATEENIGTDTWFNASLTTDLENYISPTGNLTLLAVARHFGIGLGCPFLYGWDGESYQFIDSTIQAAILQRYEATSYQTTSLLQPRMALPEICSINNSVCNWLRRSGLWNGYYDLMLYMGVPHRAYINNLGLWVVDHPQGTEIIPDQSGIIHTISDPQPVTAVDKDGDEVTSILARQDGEYWESDLAGKDFTDETSLYDWVTLTLPEDRQDGMAKLVVDVRWSPFGELKLWYFFHYIAGTPYYELLYFVMENAEELIPYFDLQMRGTSTFIVQYWDGSQWVDYATLPTLSNFFDRPQIVPIDLSEIEGNQIRLLTPTGMYEIDYVAVDYTPDEAVNITELPPVQATEYFYNGSTADVLSEITSVDDSYAVIDQGDYINYRFPALPPPQDGLQRSFVLPTGGYYYVTGPEVPEDKLFNNPVLPLEDFYSPEAFSRWMLPRYAHPEEYPYSEYYHPSSIAPPFLDDSDTYCDFIDSQSLYTDYLQVVVTHSYNTPGNLTSTAITPQDLESWGNFSANHTIPSGTNISYQVLNASDNSTLCTINATQAAAGCDISTCASNASSIRVYANLTTTNTSVTPTLYDWKATYTCVAPGITVSPTSGLVTTEGGGSDTFTVVLDSEPTADVTINLTCNDSTEGNVSPASLTFNSTNWNVNQTVTVTGVDDDIDDGNITYKIVTENASSADPGYDGLEVDDVEVTNTDDDAAGITVSPTVGLVTTEGGGSDTFTVVLTSEPTADVTINLSCNDSTEGNVSPASLTFNSTNWSTNQTVTVTGVDDDIDDGNITYKIITANASSADPGYDGLEADDVEVTNTDDDAAGITVNPTVGLETTEGGGTDNFTVVLDSEPTADVTINLSCNDSTEGNVSPASLTFNSTNWSTTQTVTVTGVDDDIDDGNVTYKIITANASSTDPNYNNLEVDDVEVSNTDDDAAGVTVSPTVGLETTEAGGSDNFTVVLTTNTTADVTINLSCNDSTEGNVSPASLTFNSTNWNVNQTVTVTGVDDAIDDGNVTYKIITANASSADPGYDGLNADDVEVSNIDDDAAGITVSPTSGLVTTEGGGSDNFTVVLTTNTTADVTINLSCNDSTEGNVSPASLTFNSTNWNINQTVTVTGVDDDIDDGNITYNIITANASSADPGYDGLEVDDVEVSNTDDDAAGITVSPTSGLVTTEGGGSDNFTVVLDSEPTADVTINLSCNDSTEGNVSPASLTFNSTNWNTNQTVTVTGVDDDIDDGNISYKIITANASSADPGYDGLNADDVEVSNTDDDAAGITVSPTSGLLTTEGGGSDNFTVVLNSEPTDDVTINLSCNDSTEGNVSPASLTFNSTNWNVNQTVTVTGVDDGSADGNIIYKIVTENASSADPGYDGLNADDVEVSNTDDDAAGITVSPTSGLVTTEGGGSDNFTVVLTTNTTADVTINLSCNDSTEGNVSPASLTFNSTNWNTNQTVTVTGVDDDIIDGNVTYNITTANASSADPGYDGLEVDDVEVSNTDDDAAGVTVSPTSGLVTTEGGGSDNFTVVLTTNTTADVTINLSCNDSTEGNVSPASLTFNSTNWNVNQTVTVTGVDDDIDDGNVTYKIITANASSTDPDYNNLPVDDVEVTNTDDDAAGITVYPTVGLLTTEAGGSDNFTVVLNSEPIADVTINLSSDDTSEGNVSPASLTFNSTNWNVTQTVTVTGVDDGSADGNIIYHIITENASSADSGYDGLEVDDIEVTNVDDDTAGITVNPTSGLVTTEGGGTANFTVVLNTQPTDDVTINLSCNDSTEGNVSPASLTFNSTNWNVTQTVTVTGVDDDIDDGNVTYNITTANASSADPGYDGLEADDVEVSNTDDDAAGITVSPTVGLVTTEAGGTANFTVVLNSEPTADVTINLSSDDTSEGNVSPASVTFNSTNWNINQTVTVTGVDDAIDDGNVTYNITTASASSVDSDYDGLEVDDVEVSNIDDDAAGITVSPTVGLETTEAGGSDNFTVVLTNNTTADVTINLSCNDSTEGNVSPASLTFNSTNWNINQTVTVTGVDDDIDDGNITYKIITANASSADADYDGLESDDVEVSNTDDDVAGVTVYPTSGLVTAEGGGSDNFTVVLNSEPTADVTINLSSDDTSEGNVSPASLTFNSTNWNVTQTVTVTGVDDDIDDGNVTYKIITANASSADPNYDGLEVDDVEVSNVDDDAAGITVSPTVGLVTTEGGGSDNFTVVLTTNTTADVTINLSCNDSTEGNVSPASLTFNSTNWNINQTVTVTGVDDWVVDGNVTYKIITANASSADPGYDGLEVDDVGVTNTDDDVLLTMVVSGNGTTVPTEGDHVYPLGQVVNITATADPCYEFVNWIGDVGTIADVNASSTNITMNASYNITATFAVIFYGLTTDSSDGGSVTDPGEGANYYDCGTVVNLTATPDPCYAFVNWTGTGVGAVADPNSPSTNITMNDTYSITANFADAGITYNLTTNSTDGGNVTTPGEETASYNCSEVVPLVATADAGYVFVEWTGNITTIANPFAAATTITMLGNYSVAASFEAETITYNLTTNSSLGGSVTTPGEPGPYTYNVSEVVNISATPDAGNSFVEWTGDISTIDDVYAANTTTIMIGNCSITANFGTTYELTIGMTGPGTGWVTTPGEGTFTFVEGTVVDLVAEPEVCSVFGGWTGPDADKVANASAASTTITMNDDYSINARFNVYPGTCVATIANPPEGGWIKGGGPATCGKFINLHAHPNECYYFVNWSGDLNSTKNPDKLYVTGNHTVIANFALLGPYDLTTGSTAGGNVTQPGEPGPYTCNCSEVVPLEATAPDTCSYFVQWTGDTGEIADDNAASTTITMYDNYSINATFAELGPYHLTVVADPDQGGNVTGEGNYACGTNVTVNATSADECWYFAGWTGDVADPDSPSTTTYIDRNKMVTADFDKYRYNVTVTSSGCCPIDVSGLTTVDANTTHTFSNVACGTNATLTADDSDPCCEFVEWTVNGSGQGPGVNPINVTITSNLTANATCSVITYNLTVNASPVEGGNVTGGGTFDCCANASITATPNECYYFVNWTGDVADPDSLSTTVHIDANKTVTANFAALGPYALTVSSTDGGNVTDPGEGTQGPYDCGTVVNLTATPDAGYEFANWIGDTTTIANANAANTTITILGNYNITANFEPVGPTPTPWPGGWGGWGGWPLLPQLDVDLWGDVSSWYRTYYGVLLQDVDATSIDGRVTVHIPRLTTVLDCEGQPLDEIVVTPIDLSPTSPEGYDIIAAFDFQPTGTTFDPGMEITIACDPDALPEGVEEASLFVALLDEATGEWEFIVGVVWWEPILIRFTFSVDHFTIFAVLAQLAPTPTPTPTPTPVAGLGPGAWTGIGLAILLVIGLILWLIIRQRNLSRRTPTPSRRSP